MPSTNPLSKKPLVLALLLALTATAQAANDAPYFTADGTTDTVIYDGEELTPNPHNGREAILVTGGGDLTIKIADGKTLKIDSQVGTDSRPTFRDEGVVVNVANGNLKIEGGTLELHKTDSFVEDATQTYNQQAFFQVGSSSALGTLAVESEKVLLTGSVALGISNLGQTDITFKNGFAMNLDRSEALSVTSINGVNIWGDGENLSTFTVGKDASVEIKTGPNDFQVIGTRLRAGVKATFGGKYTIKIDASKSPSLRLLQGFMYDYRTHDPEVIDLLAEGEFTVDMIGNGQTPAQGIYALGTLQFEDVNVNLDKVGANSIGLWVTNRATAVKGVVTAKGLTFNATNTKETQGVQVLDGSLDLQKATINFADSTSSLGIKSLGEGKATIAESLTVKADTALQARDTSQIDIQKNFETTQESALLVGMLDAELPQPTEANPNPEKGSQTATMKINSRGEGLVRFTGATLMQNHDAGAALEMTVGATSTALSDQSYWNVTAPSTLTKLTLGKNARLNFYINADSGVYNSDASMITVDGNNPVALTKESGSGIALVVSGIDWKAKDTFGLITSSGGFTLGGSTLAEGADLNDLKKDDLSVTSINSVASLSESKVAAKDYDLLLQTDKRLVAKIKGEEEKPEPQPKPLAINEQTDSLMESSVSTFGTLFAADDLFVDSVLRSRDGAHQEGLFAAARAGKWSLNTRTDVDMTAVTGLVGYAARAGATEFGAFLEMGHSSYDTMTPAKLGDVKGTGRHNYAGLGLYVDYTTPVDGLALTGYVKAGAFSNHFNATLVNEKVDFDRTKTYWGVHLGAHYDWNLAKLRNRTFFSYFYDGTESSSYRIADSEKVAGATFDYDALNAHRVQVGNLMEYALSDTLRPYFGVTLEKTLSAKAKGSATDAEGTLALHSSTMEGTTGILSAGWSYLNPAATFEFGVGVNGYIGARQGATAQVQATWKC